MKPIAAFALCMTLCNCAKQNPILGGWTSPHRGSMITVADLLFTPRHLVTEGGARRVNYKVEGKTVTLIGKNLPIQSCTVLDRDTIKCDGPMLDRATLKRSNVKLKEPTVVADLNTSTAAQLIATDEDFTKPRVDGVSLNAKQAQCGVQHGWWTVRPGGVIGDQPVLTVRPGQEKSVGFTGELTAQGSVWTIRYAITRELGKVRQISPGGISPKQLDAVDATDSKLVDFTWRWKRPHTDVGACGAQVGSESRDRPGQAIVFNIKDDGWTLAGLR